jgi:hypothetical protein
MDPCPPGYSAPEAAQLAGGAVGLASCAAREQDALRMLEIGDPTRVMTRSSECDPRKGAAAGAQQRIAGRVGISDRFGKKLIHPVALAASEEHSGLGAADGRQLLWKPCGLGPSRCTPYCVLSAVDLAEGELGAGVELPAMGGLAVEKPSRWLGVQRREPVRRRRRVTGRVFGAGELDLR